MNCFQFNKVWDSKSEASISFCDPNGADIAVVVENDLIQASLNRTLSDFSNLSVFNSTNIKDIDRNNASFLDLNLSNDLSIRTKLLIGSDGANSLIRSKANMNVSKWDYDQIAICATLKLDEVKNCMLNTIVNKHFEFRQNLFVLFTLLTLFLENVKSHSMAALFANRTNCPSPSNSMFISFNFCM